MADEIFAGKYPVKRKMFLLPEFVLETDCERRCFGNEICVENRLLKTMFLLMKFVTYNRLMKAMFILPKFIFETDC